jgi:stress-induced morphogen
MSVSITAEYLEAKLKSQIEGVEYVKATDESGGCGAKFVVLIIASAFEGKPVVMQHRLCHKALEEEMRSIHALTLKTVTPSAWTTHPDNPDVSSN